MRYSTEPKYRKYVKGYGFLLFTRRFIDKYGKQLLNTATKTIIDTAKTASKQVVQKTAEATEDIIRNKIVDKITSLGKIKSKHCSKNYISQVLEYHEQFKNAEKTFHQLFKSKNTVFPISEKFKTRTSS